MVTRLFTHGAGVFAFNVEFSVFVRLQVLYSTGHRGVGLDKMCRLVSFYCHFDGTVLLYLIMGEGEK